MDKEYILITGANSGVGLGIVKRLIEEHYERCTHQLILILGCRNVLRAERVCTIKHH